jgi:hypothetical protein
MTGNESNTEKLSIGYRAIIEAHDKELAEWKTWVNSHVPRLERDRDKLLAQIEAHQATVMRQQDEIERLTRLLAAALAACPESYSGPIMEVLRNKAKKESGQWKESEL